MRVWRKKRRLSPIPTGVALNVLRAFQKLGRDRTVGLCNRETEQAAVLVEFELEPTFHVVLSEQVAATRPRRSPEREPFRSRRKTRGEVA
jgi:hypothetical protein